MADRTKRKHQRRAGKRDQRFRIGAGERSRIRKTSEFFRKLSLNALKNWHQNRGAKRLVVIKVVNMARSADRGLAVGTSCASPVGPGGARPVIGRSASDVLLPSLIPSLDLTLSRVRAS
jgi:hypothetical protein